MNAKSEQQSTSWRVRAGVRMTVVGPLASMSSWTTALLRTTVPTRVSARAGPASVAAGRRRAGLGVGVGAPGRWSPRRGDPVHGGAHRHHDLVGPVRIGHPSLDDGDPVLVEEDAVDAAVDVHVGRSAAAVGSPVRGERHAVDVGVALGMADVGQLGDLGHEGTVVAGGEAEGGVPDGGAEAEVGGVGAGQNVENDDSVRRAAAIAPMARPPIEPDQQHQGQVGAPAAPEGGPESVAGRRGAHRFTVRPRRVRGASTSSPSHPSPCLVRWQSARGPGRPPRWLAAGCGVVPPPRRSPHLSDVFSGPIEKTAARPRRAGMLRSGAPGLRRPGSPPRRPARGRRAGLTTSAATPARTRLGYAVSASKMRSGPVLGSVAIPLNICPKASPKIQ